MAGIVVYDGSVLVQKPVDEPNSCFAFIGGEYEAGDTFEHRLRVEFEEETTAEIVALDYLFCVENQFHHNKNLVQQVEHYFRVELDRTDVESREAHLKQHWLPITSLAEFDLRPHVVRDAIVDGRWTSARHMVVLA